MLHPIVYGTVNVQNSFEMVVNFCTAVGAGGQGGKVLACEKFVL